MSPSLKHAIFFLLILVFLTHTGAIDETASFNLTSDGCSTIEFLGEAQPVDDRLVLTRVSSGPSSGAGGAFSRNPVALQHSASGIPVTFSTQFSLLINNSNNGDTGGGGAAMVMSPDYDQIGGAGDNLGVPSGAVAIEFDTRKDTGRGDINANHLGVNLGNTMVCSKVINLDLFKIDLGSGRQLNAWVDYSGATQQLSISLSYRDGKPTRPVLSTRVNLGRYMLNGLMYVGFTASTQASTETHSVLRWSFNSWFVGPPPYSRTASQQQTPAAVQDQPSNVPRQKKAAWDRLSIVVGTAAGAVLLVGGVGIIRNCNICNGRVTVHDSA